LPAAEGPRPLRCEGPLFFGSFGKRGLGYSVPELVQALRQILGLTRHYRVALIGAGKIGSALVQNRGFRRRGFDFVAIFDRDPAKVGQELGGVRDEDVTQLEASLGRSTADIAVLVTPPEEAQSVADRLVQLGSPSSILRRCSWPYHTT
jgi:redox-sensing transcriptional repressor